ncbi:AaceriAFL165Wp [[Ashbya] aceris (nom. inval.)]|nr:AaceriAFL165Wp [[Ashbya] aceris (nom. inval.)]
MWRVICGPRGDITRGHRDNELCYNVVSANIIGQHYRTQNMDNRRRSAEGQQPPCKAEACAIQACLKRNGYEEGRCAAAVDALYTCCAQFYEREGREARSACCPAPDVVAARRK